MTTKHTPGPWEFDPEADEVTTTDRIKNSMTCIAVVETGWTEPFESEQQSNARLIAAAPELFDALLRIANGQEMTAPFTHADTVLRYQEIARAAIAKATGEPQ